MLGDREEALAHWEGTELKSPLMSMVIALNKCYFTASQYSALEAEPRYQQLLADRHLAASDIDRMIEAVNRVNTYTGITVARDPLPA